MLATPYQMLATPYHRIEEDVYCLGELTAQRQAAKEGVMTGVRTLGWLAACFITGILSARAYGEAADTMHLTDEPGNWFRSDATGTPLSVIRPGERVDFKIDNCCTSTRHTVTLLVKPVGSAIALDQDKSQHGTLSLEFDVPGVYVLVCKIHPYMTAVVAVTDQQGQIPDVTAAQLPFIGHLGVDALPAADVLAVMTTVAATDADKLAKWEILGPESQVRPGTPGVGEVWVNSQFERVPGQVDESDVAKPGTITVIDAATFTIEREINGLAADGMWNNPHNMWSNFRLDTIYNTNWFGKWLNRIDRASGQITSSITVGEAPTHVITIPTPGSDRLGDLTIPLSAEKEMATVEDAPTGLNKIDEEPTGSGENNPHGHWLTCGLGDRAIVPNVFLGLGFAGSVSILDSDTGTILREFLHDPNDPLQSALLMPIAAGNCHVDGVQMAYVANVVSGMVTVIDVDALRLVANIPVTLTPDGQQGLNLLHTLQAPIQTPVSPDERWVATAVLSLTTVGRPPTGAADHVAIIDTRLNQVVAFLPARAGAHGVNWGAKLGGGYYAYVSNQHSNAMTIVDPDPNGDDNGNDAAVVGTILLSNGSNGAGVTDGTGGQGIKPLPITHDGWIQPTVALAGTGALSPEVEGWIAALTDFQQNPVHEHSGVGEPAQVAEPTGPRLLHVFPNPSAPRATFTLEVAEPQQVRVTLHDAAGRRVAVIYEGVLTRDTHRFEVDVPGLASGVYFVQAVGEKFEAKDRFTYVN